jgi:hypothetical protein
MNLKKEIFERISSIEKVELSDAKKVELALVDDLKKIYSEALKYENTFEKIFNDATKNSKTIEEALNQKSILLKKIDDYKDEIGNTYKKVYESSKKIISMTKELGLNINDLPIYKEYLETLNSVKKSSDVLQKSRDLISKY